MLVRIYCFYFVQTGSYYIAQAEQELTVLSQPDVLTSAGNISQPPAILYMVL